MPGPRSWEASRGQSGRRSSRLSTALPSRTVRPAPSTSTSAAVSPTNGDPLSAIARPIALSRAAIPAAFTAEPVLAAVVDPPEPGVCGMSVSPSSKRTRSGGRPRASAAICVMIVIGSRAQILLRAGLHVGGSIGQYSGHCRRLRAARGIGHAVRHTPAHETPVGQRASTVVRDSDPTNRKRSAPCR